VVTHALDLPLATLATLPRRELTADFHCVAGWSATDLGWEGAGQSVARPVPLPPGELHVLGHVPAEGEFTEGGACQVGADESEFFLGPALNRSCRPGGVDAGAQLRASWRRASARTKGSTPLSWLKSTVALNASVAVLATGAELPVARSQQARIRHLR
jgi:hypothetical protein